MSTLTEEKEREIRKNNMHLYPIYTMIGYDLLFFYGLRVMFLSDIKGFTNSEIVLSSSLFAIFTVIMQFPATVLTSKIGKRNGAILGNIINIIWALLLFVIKDFGGLVLLQLVSASAFALKAISESNLLSDSIPESEKSNEIFTNIDKRGYSRYCFLCAISTIIAGFLYKINPYIPIVMTLACIIVSTILSLNFIDIEKKKRKEKGVKEYIKELRQGYKFTVNSKRLRSLLLMTGIIWGTIILIDTYQLALLQDIGATSSQIGIIFALFELAKAFASRNAPEYNKRFRNRSLTNILATFSFCLIIAGIIATLSIPFIAKVMIIVLFILVMGSISATAQILAKKYLNNFTNTKILPSIYSAKAITDNISRTVITGIGSLILTFCTIDYAMIIAGVILILVTFIMSIYMSNKLGLDPDKYTQKEIYIRK